MQEDFQLTINGLSYRAAGTPLKMSLADFLKNQSIELSDGLVHRGHGGLLFFLIDFNSCAGPVHRLIKPSRTSLISMAERELVAIDSRVEDPNESSLWVKLKAIKDSSKDEDVSLSRTISIGLEGLDDGQGYSLFSDHLSSAIRRNESGMKVSTKHLLTVPTSVGRLKKLTYKSSEGELFYRPGTVLEAIRIRVLRQGSCFVGGGLFAEDGTSESGEAVFISLESIDELREITFEDGHWTVGACVSLRSFAERLKTKFPLIDDFCKSFRDTHFVNRYTVWEEFSSSGPSSGILTVLLSLGAEVIIDGLDERRRMSLEELLYVETLSSVGEQELISSVIIPEMKNSETITSHYQVMKGSYEKDSIIRASFLVELDSKNKVSDSSIWFDIGSGLPMRFESAEKLIEGRPWTRDLEQQVSSVISSGDGIGGSLGLGEEFQKILIQNLLSKFINEHLGEVGQGSSRYQFIDLESELTVRKNN
jgi:CO/xanthine dehydrogenase FAD-binding subunit